MIFKYQFTTDEDQVMLDMLQYFDDIGLPSHIDEKAYESLWDKFFFISGSTKYDYEFTRTKQTIQTTRI